MSNQHIFEGHFGALQVHQHAQGTAFERAIMGSTYSLAINGKGEA